MADLHNPAVLRNLHKKSPPRWLLTKTMVSFQHDWITNSALHGSRKSQDFRLNNAIFLVWWYLLATRKILAKRAFDSSFEWNNYPSTIISLGKLCYLKKIPKKSCFIFYLSKTSREFKKLSFWPFAQYTRVLKPNQRV